MSTFNDREAFLFLPVGVIITEGGARSKGILACGCEAKKNMHAARHFPFLSQLASETQPSSPVPGNGCVSVR